MESGCKKRYSKSVCVRASPCECTCVSEREREREMSSMSLFNIVCIYLRLFQPFQQEGKKFECERER